MKGNYIGNNPNGLDFVLVDNKTTNIVAGEVVVKDVLFNNLISLTDSGALGKARYISASQSFNIDTDDFDLVVIYASSENSSGTYPPFPGFLYIRQFYYSRTSSTVIGNRIQVAFAYNVNKMWRRYHLDGSWSDWVKVIDETDRATSSTPGIVQLNNTTSSTSASQAATANAVKLAYDKAVAAYTKAESAQESSASADKLTTARTIQTNLASTTSASFDGTKNVTPGVTGVLPAANGGTGRTDGKAPSLVTKRTIDGVNFDGSANIHHYGTCSTAADTAAKTVTLANFVLATGAIAFIRFTVTNTASSPTLNINSTGAKAIRYRNETISAGHLAANRTYCFIYDGSYYQLVGDIDTNTTYTAASAAPKAPGTAAVGTSIKYAREDHVHPLQTTVSGNASSATKLATARTIDGVSFNGTANITHFGVCNTEAATAAKTVSVTGFTLATGAELTVQFTVTNTAASPTLNVNNTGAKAIVYRNAAISAGYLAANRVYKFVYDGTNYELIGDVNTDTNTDTKVTQTVTTTNAEYPLLISADAAKTSSSTTTARFASAVTLNPSTKKISCSGISGKITGSNYVNSAKDGGSLIDIPGLTTGGYQPIFKTKSTNGAFVMSGYQAYLGMHYITDENIEAGTNTVTQSLKFEESGLLTSSGGFKGSLTGNASSATKLATARTIDGVSFNGTANITHFGKCSTEAATAAKVVSVANFVLATGSEVTVQFTVTNTAKSPTLNVNGTGAKAIVYRNAAISAGYLAANRVYKFVYDGTNYELIGDIDTNNKYTAATAAPKAPGTAAVGTSSKYAREDHVHPLQTTVSGNAGSATKLATARTISLTGVVEGSVSFDGSKNVSITTTADGIGGSIPIGGIIAFSGTFGGTNNRFPIPLGSTTPDTNWCLCDGTKTNNLNVPDLRGRMILGASTSHAAGTKGGAETHTHSISGTIGATTLTVEQMPSHTHGYRKVTWWNGWNGRNDGDDCKPPSDGQPTDATGGSQSHTHTLSGAKSGSASSLPPYYSLAYIIKIG